MTHFLSLAAQIEVFINMCYIRSSVGSDRMDPPSSPYAQQLTLCTLDPSPFILLDHCCQHPSVTRLWKHFVSSSLAARLLAATPWHSPNLTRLSVLFTPPVHLPVFKVCFSLQVLTKSTGGTLQTSLQSQNILSQLSLTISVDIKVILFFHFCKKASPLGL